MDPLSLLALSVGLAMDAFAVAISMGLTLPRVRTTQMLRLAVAFGGFQALMPVVGWLAGRTLAGQGWVAAYDHWIAFVLLGGLGAKMIYEARFLPDSEEDKAVEKDPTMSVTLIVLAIATSIDALLVGVSLSLLRVTIFGPSIVIGLTAAAFAAVGIHLGHRFGHKLGTKVEVFGGLALIAIGVRILVEHLMNPTPMG
jgi:putative Mn2+ efflux pump MntP